METTRAMAVAKPGGCMGLDTQFKMIIFLIVNLQIIQFSYQVLNWLLRLRRGRVGVDESIISLCF